jgi:hypothetical protein
MLLMKLTSSIENPFTRQYQKLCRDPCGPGSSATKYPVFLEANIQYRDEKEERGDRDSVSRRAHPIRG